MTSRHQTIGEVPITIDERGEGRPALNLHGGGGSATVMSIAEHLGATMRTLTPTHPGWDGTPLPPQITSIGDLASLYLDLFEAEGLTDVAVVGNSIGGWIALEMAIRDERGAIGDLVLIDSMGIAVDGEPITDFFALDARGVADTSFYDSDRFYIDPASMSEEQAAAMKANLTSLRALAGDPYMHDPELRDRLAGIDKPTEVIWGDSDGIASPAYGRALADSIPGAHFDVVSEAGHLPHLEQPDRTFALVDGFLARDG